MHVTYSQNYRSGYSKHVGLRQYLSVCMSSVPSVRRTMPDKQQTHRISRARPDTSHDRNEDMLLDRERTGVKLDTKYLDVGEELGPGAADGEGDELSDNL